MSKREIPFIPLLFVVLTVLLGVLSAPIANAIGLPNWIKPFALPLLLCIAFVLSLIAVSQYFLQEKKAEPFPAPSYQNRVRLLERVHAFWITGVLEQSLHSVALITLGLQERKDILANPWHLTFQHLEEPARALPASTHITEVFDNSLGELLILGEPGSGKTTLLLELARDLLKRAATDTTYPIPVIFNLSSWAEKRQSLVDWLVDELKAKYQVPRQVGQSWIDNDQVLLLLDGLDEVSSSYRGSCVNAINNYRQEHGLAFVVVCSRSTDYFSLKQRLLLHSAVIIQQLTEQQIDDFLVNSGEQVEGVRVAIYTDPELKELAATPLMLSLLALAYHGISVESILDAGAFEVRRQHLFKTYIHRMLQSRGGNVPYSSQKTMHWLSWLAKQMMKHSQTEFYIERLQMDWLSNQRLRRLYYGIAGGLIYSLVFCLVSALGDGLAQGLIEGLGYGLAFGLIFGIFGKINASIKPERFTIWSWMGLRWLLTTLLEKRAIAGLIFGVFNGLIVGISGNDLEVAMAALINGGLIYWLLGEPDVEIKPKETVVWSWTSMRRNLIKLIQNRLIIVCGTVIGVALIFSRIPYYIQFYTNWYQEFELNSNKGLRIGLLSGLVYGVLTLLFFLAIFLIAIGLTGGLSNKVLPRFKIIKPNQGIWLSLRNGLVVGLISGIIIGLCSGIINWLTNELSDVIVNGFPGFALILKDAVISGLLTWLISFAIYSSVFLLREGGIVYLQHMTLRLFLWYAGFMPCNYPKFLDYAADHILLRRVGGGYIFIHRLFMEYFATLNTTSSGRLLAD